MLYILPNVYLSTYVLTGILTSVTSAAINMFKGHCSMLVYIPWVSGKSISLIIWKFQFKLLEPPTPALWLYQFILLSRVSKYSSSSTHSAAFLFLMIYILTGVRKSLRTVWTGICLIAKNYEYYYNSYWPLWRFECDLPQQTQIFDV